MPTRNLSQVLDVAACPTVADRARSRALSRSTAFVLVFTLLAVAAAFLLPAMPQPLDYHDFADHRGAFGINNFLDVVSNVAFLLAGLYGLVVVFSGRACFEFPGERWPYAVFFLGVLLTAAGSAYYHLSPDNETLFWDRLPMTIAFMGLLSSQVVDRISVRAGLVLLAPMLLVGMGSVVYWIVTERAGAGNVLPYGILQGYSVVVLLLMAAMHRSRYTRGNDLYFIFGWYVLAKVLESADAQVLAYSHFVSGHTLKHVAAAAAGFVACRMLMRRTLAEPGRAA
ncbi:MAG: alkaline phytoceramidase [Gammaproteobacteria bacterium]|nr:alkaline phytoceramidase [Gammaproteobacteria bacterium]